MDENESSTLSKRQFQFSDRLIERLPFSSNSQIEYRDKTIPGLYLRVGKLSKTFMLIKRVSDTESGTISVLRKITIGKFPSIRTAEARTIATELLGQIGRGIDPVVKKKREEEQKREEAKRKEKQEITLRKALDAYVEEKRLSGDIKRSTAESKYKYDFELYGRDILDLPLSQITKERVKDLTRRLLPEDPESRHRHTSIGIFLRSLSAVLNFANEEYFGDSLFLPGKNPAKLARELVKTSEPRDRVLTKAELEIFFRYLYERSSFNLSPNLSSTSDLFLFVLFTGCRKEEGTTLEWKTVDLSGDPPKLTFLRTKTEPQRTIPFSRGFLFELLTKRKQGIDSPYVFPGPGKTGHIAEPKNLLQRFLKYHHDMPSFSVHDLRRTFATYGQTAGNPAAVDAIIGHKPQTVTGRHYTAFTDEQKAKAMADIEKVLLDACGFFSKKLNWGESDVRDDDDRNSCRS